MPIRIKKLGQKGGPKGQDKTMPPSKGMPRVPKEAEEVRLNRFPQQGWLPVANLKW